MQLTTWIILHTLVILDFDNYWEHPVDYILSDFGGDSEKLLLRSFQIKTGISQSLFLHLFFPDHCVGVDMIWYDMKRYDGNMMFQWSHAFVFLIR